MKLIVNVARFLVGILFVFSGLVKAIDPLGLAYKMQEFFEAWANDGYFKNLMLWLNNYATGFSVFMIVLEVVLGIALLVGWQKKITAWLLFLLTLFFTFLTSYVLFSNKIKACGCFGDCIPLTPIQTFTKDIVLTFLIILILIKTKYIYPIFKKIINHLVILLSIIGVLILQFYVLKHLPIKDCLPYKVGNNILELRKIPVDAVYDKFAYTYFFKKGSQEQEFEYGKQPDSTWIWEQEKLPIKKLIEKGNGKEALIKDFTLTTANGNDSTDAILNTSNYYLLFCKEFNSANNWVNDFELFYTKNNNAKPIFIVTANVDAANKLFASLKIKQPNNLQIFSCDGTAIKTAARVNPTIFEMKGPIILGKWAAADFLKVIP